MGVGTLSLVTPPSGEPISLEEARQQVRREDVVDYDDDAFMVGILIPAARSRAEKETGRQFLEATWDLRLDRFPCGTYDAIEVPKSPLLTVTGITYVDTDGVTQTWSSSKYVVDAPAGPTAKRGRISLAYGESWPSTRYQPNAVTVRFTAGYGDQGADVPPRLRQAMLLDIGTMFEHREDIVVGQGYAIAPFPIGVEQIYRSFRSY